MEAELPSTSGLSGGPVTLSLVGEEMSEGMMDFGNLVPACGAGTRGQGTKPSARSRCLPTEARSFLFLSQSLGGGGHAPWAPLATYCCGQRKDLPPAAVS